MATFTVAPATGGGGDRGPPLYWTGTDERGLPAADYDPSRLTNPSPVYQAGPGEKPTFGGGAGGPAGRSFTITPPGAAPTTPGVPAPLPPTGAAPADQTQPAPAAPPVAGVVPPPQAMPARPAAPAEQAPASQQMPPVRGFGPVIPPPALTPAGPVQRQVQAPTWGHTTGLLAAKALEGIPQTFAGAADLGNLAVRAMGGTWLPAGYFGGQVERGYQALGLPEPESRSEKTLATIAEALGGTLGTMGVGGALNLVGRGPAIARALLAMPGRQFLGAGGAGLGADVAERGGGGTAGQIAASVLGALAGHGAGTAALTAYRGGKAATQSARSIAGQQLAEMSSSPGTLQQRLATAGYRGLPTAPQTTAMAARDPRLAVLEDALRGTPEGANIRAVQAARNVAISRALSGMRLRGGTTEMQRGQVIRRVLQENERTLDRRTDQLYTAARAGTGTYNLDPMLSRLTAAQGRYYGPGSGGAPQAFRDIARQILDRGRTASNEWLINMDRQVGDAARIAARAGDRTQAAALREIQRGLDAIHGSPELQAAKAHRARTGAVLGRDQAGARATGDILAEDQYGRPIRTDEQVAQRAVKDLASVRQVLRSGDEALAAARAGGASQAEITAIMTRNAATRAMLREQFLENAESKARVTGGTMTVHPTTGAQATHATYSPAQWRRFWDDNERIADELFSPAHRQTLRQITNQLADDAALTQAASAQGSHTQQRIAHTLGGPTIGNVVSVLTQGRLAAHAGAGRILARAIEGIPGLAAMFAHGPIAGVAVHQLGAPLVHGLLENKDLAIRALLADAAADPVFAQQLLREGHAAAVRNAIMMSQQRGGRFWSLLKRLSPVSAAAESGANTPPVRAR